MHEAKPDDPALARFADRLQALMPRLLRGMMRQERSSLARGEITLPQMWMLQTLLERGTCVMGDLAQELRVGRSTATGLADRLVGMGLMRREHDAADRRTVRAALTARGRRMMEELYREKRRLTVRLFGTISARDRAAYLRVMERMVGNIEHLDADEAASARAG